MRWLLSYQESKAQRSFRDPLARSCLKFLVVPSTFRLPPSRVDLCTGTEVRPRGGRPLAMVLTLPPLSLPLPVISLLPVLSPFFSPFPFLPPLPSCSAKIIPGLFPPAAFPVNFAGVSVRFRSNAAGCGERLQEAYTSVLEGPMAETKRPVWCWPTTYIQHVVPFFGWAFIQTCLNGFCLTCRLLPS